MLVSIGIPFYNARSTLTDAIRSVFAQTYEEWELLLLDDGSSDDSLRIARSVEDARVRVISDGKNRGVSYRHNQMAALARGEYLAKLDDDDLMHPGRLRAQCAYLAANNGTDLTGSAVYTIDLENNVTGLRRCTAAQVRPEVQVRQCSLYTSTITGRVAWFRRYSYDERYRRSQDRDFFCRTFADASVHVDSMPLVFYREGRSRTAQKYKRNAYWDRRIFLQHGPKLLGWRQTVGLIANSFIKSNVYSLLWLAGLQEFSIRRGRVTVTAEERARAAAILDSVRHARVPGLD